MTATKRRHRSAAPPSVMEPHARAGDGEDGDGNRGGGDAAAAVAVTSTLGARARALGSANERSKASAQGDGEEARASGTRRPLDDALGGTGTEGGGAKADSLAALLSQALRADDVALIERCLSVSDRTTIANTVAKLSATNAMKLLSECAARAQAKPNAGERCAKWARTILLHHAGYASSAPKARATLMRLSQTIESHVSMQGSLQALLGRLELVLHASATSRGGGAERVAVEEADTMTTVYSEATDAVDVLQDVMGRDRAAEGGSVEEEEEEWETDEDEDEDEDEDDESDDEDDEDMEV